FFRLSPALFRQEQNITDNKKLYLEYIALQNGIRTYVATGKVVENDSAMALPDFVRHVERQRMLLNLLPLGFDESKIPDYSAMRPLGEPSQ
ncbi:MAG TPA: hypothetical protein VGB15_24540, partial [Longimicrobium sp.]